MKGGLDAKAAFIHGLFSSMPTGRALIFSNSGKNAHAVAAALLAAGTRCGAVASIDEAGKTLDMASRMVIFAEVSSGVTRLLATTDLYARGVDIPGLQVVVNLDPPKKHGGGGGGLDKTTFTHRCGRVGRVSPEGATVGVVINLANEESIEEPEYRDVSTQGCTVPVARPPLLVSRRTAATHVFSPAHLPPYLLPHPPLFGAARQAERVHAVRPARRHEGRGGRGAGVHPVAQARGCGCCRWRRCHRLSSDGVRSCQGGGGACVFCGPQTTALDFGTN